MLKKYLIFALLISVTVFSQTKIKIKGQLFDGKNLPFTETEILLVSPTSEEPIKAAITDSLGNYEFETSVSTFRILVAAAGHEKYLTAVITVNSEEYRVTDIHLHLLQETLKEVTITKRKPFVIRKTDRIVINPDALISGAGLTALEVLEKAPSVLVDLNGNISIKGKSGVVIFIDDKPTYLSASDLASYLRSIPGSTIESIEIMTNPPARYDAAGNSGIINIRLKKNIAKGINGGINLAYGQGKYHRTNNSFTFNYRIQKWNFFSNLSVSENNSYQDLTIKRTYFTPTGELSSVFTQNSYIKPHSNNYSLKTGADYYISAKTTLGLVLSGFNNPSERSTTNNAIVQNSDLQPISTIVAENPMHVRFRNGSINLNMNHKINDKGKEIAVNLDHIAYDSKIKQELTNSVFNSDGSLNNTSVLQSKLPSNIKIISGQTDFSGLSLRGGTFDAGVKASYVKTNNVASFFDVVNDAQIPNYDFSNDFTYQERIQAVYTNYAKDFKKFSLQLGLRLERTHIDGHQKGNPIVADSSFTIKYTNLFPTVFVQYRLDSIQKHVFGLSLGRRIDRPNYKDLNPFTYPMDRYTYYGGNPYLKPTFSYNAELSHTYKQYFTTTLSYSYIDDIISETNEQRGTTYYSRPGNFARQISYGLSVSATFSPFKWWTAQYYAGVSNDYFKSGVYTESLNDSMWSWVFMPTNQFVINKRFSAEISGQYQSRALSGQFVVSGIGSIRAGVSMKVLNNKGAVKLNVSDIFYTNQVEGEIRNIQFAKAGWFSYLDSRVVTVAFSYRFSKGDNLKVRQSGSAETEKSRVKV